MNSIIKKIANLSFSSIDSCQSLSSLIWKQLLLLFRWLSVTFLKTAFFAKMTKPVFPHTSDKTYRSWHAKTARQVTVDARSIYSRWQVICKMIACFCFLIFGKTGLGVPAKSSFDVFDLKTFTKYVPVYVGLGRTLKKQH